MSRRFRSVDIVKGVAMIMVILVHYGQNYFFNFAKAFEYLQMGCQLFFVASGFGIMCLINSKYDGLLNKNNVKSFYYSRIKALAPGWYVAFAIIFLVNTFLLYFKGEMLSFGTNRNWISIVCNLLFLNGLLPFCCNNVMPGGWYIGTTAVFYALTPIILYALNRESNKKRFFIISSILGMLLWTALYFIFRGAFLYDGFGYCFFLVHYPEYLLGMMLYFDFSSHVLNDSEIKRCIPFSIAALIISIILFYYPKTVLYIPSAWMIALATYFALYYMLSNEQNKEYSLISRIMEEYGKNSYYIFLIHAFFAWTFVKKTLLLLEKTGFSVMVSFFILIPVTLFLAYYAGLAFRALIRKINILH